MKMGRRLGRYFSKVHKVFHGNSNSDNKAFIAEQRTVQTRRCEDVREIT